jgi:amino acid transporter/mannitol/fructose-specific phosphotransferase system IIA component (Ntr-type)
VTPIGELKRQLGLLDVFSLAAGAMISSGLFVLPGIAFSLTGPSLVLSYFLASLLMIPAMCAQAELATAMPKAGGTYFFVERSLGPLVGTFAGFANWMSIALKAAFALVGIGTLGTLFLPWQGEFGVKIVALGACIVFGMLNVFSVKGTARFQTLMVLALLGILLAYMLTSAPQFELSHFTPFAPGGFQAVFMVAGMVFVSYGGLTKVASVGEEVQVAGRNLPLGMFIAYFVVNAFYLVTVAITIGVLSAEELSDSLRPIAAAADKTMGPASMIVPVAALLAFVTTANAGILSAARSPLAMSRDGLVLEMLSHTNKRFGTPHVSIFFTCAFMIACISALSIENLVKTASAVMIIMFILVNLALIIMRQSGLQNYRPVFKAPLYPWMPILGIMAYVFMLFEMGAVPLMLTGAFALGTLAWYFVYVHRRIERESAFVFLVKRIIARQIGERGLENELRAIALERDGIESDRFDALVRGCPILDREDAMTLDELLTRASDMLGPRVAMCPVELKGRLVKREQESSTVIQPGLAIPHVIVDGQGLFELLLVRCKGGIAFSEGLPPVTSAFFLLGTSDERNFHLSALMAIAHIVQERGFRDRWARAAGEEGLRDVLLLSKRERQARYY